MDRMDNQTVPISIIKEEVQTPQIDLAEPLLKKIEDLEISIIRLERIVETPLSILLLSCKILIKNNDLPLISRYMSLGHILRELIKAIFIYNGFSSTETIIDAATRTIGKSDDEITSDIKKKIEKSKIKEHIKVISKFEIEWTGFLDETQLDELLSFSNRQSWQGALYTIWGRCGTSENKLTTSTEYMTKVFAFYKKTDPNFYEFNKANIKLVEDKFKSLYGSLSGYAHFGKDRYSLPFDEGKFYQLAIETIDFIEGISLQAIPQRDKLDQIINGQED